MNRTAEQLKNNSATLLDADEAVKFLNNKFSKWTLYDLVRRKEIPHVKISRRVFFRAETLVSWLTELEAASVSKQELRQNEIGKIRRLK